MAGGSPLVQMSNEQSPERDAAEETDHRLLTMDLLGAGGTKLENGLPIKAPLVVRFTCCHPPIKLERLSKVTDESLFSPYPRPRGRVRG